MLAILKIKIRTLIIDKLIRSILTLIKLRRNSINKPTINGIKANIAIDIERSIAKSIHHPYNTLRTKELPVISGEYLDNIVSIDANIQKIE